MENTLKVKTVGNYTAEALTDFRQNQNLTNG